MLKEFLRADEKLFIPELNPIWKKKKVLEIENKLIMQRIFL